MLNLHRLTSFTLLYSLSLLLACCTPPVYHYALANNCLLTHSLTPPASGCLQTTYAVSYKTSTWTYRKYITWSLFTVVWSHRLGRSVYTKLLLRKELHNPIVPPLLSADDIKKTASSIVACWSMFTELLPGNALIKSTTIQIHK
jgi:hypothetical protein